MMQPLRLNMWQEEISLEEAFQQLLETGLEVSVLKEMGKRILYIRSFKEYDIPLPPTAEVEKMRDAFFERQKITTPELRERWYKMQRQNADQFERQLCHQNMLNRLKAVAVSEEMLKEAFLKRKPRLDSILFGLIRVESEALAKELYYRIRDDKQDFSQLASQYSKGSEASIGGLVGPRPLGELNTELRSKLLALQPGDISQPFSLDDKMFIIARLVRLDNAQLTPQLENMIREELFDQWTDRQLGLAEISLIAADGTVSGVEALEAQPS